MASLMELLTRLRGTPALGPGMSAGMPPVDQFERMAPSFAQFGPTLLRNPEFDRTQIQPMPGMPTPQPVPQPAPGMPMPDPGMPFRQMPHLVADMRMETQPLAPAQAKPRPWFGAKTEMLQGGSPAVMRENVKMLRNRGFAEGDAVRAASRREF